MPSYVTQTELADLTGVSKQNVNYSISKGLIKTKKFGKKKRVVLDDPVTQLWYEKQIALNATATVSETKKSPSKRKAKKSDEPEDLISLQQQKTMEEIKKLKADVRLKELKYSVERENLIDKETVASVLFQYLDAFNMNALDLPDMVVDMMIDKIKAGAERGELIKNMREMIQKEIKNTKGHITERLK